MVEYEVVISPTVNNTVVEVNQSAQPQVDEVYLPVPGPPGGIADSVFGETPSGLLNGSNVVFTTAFTFNPATVQVYLNGMLLKLIDDYQLIGGTTIQLVSSPSINEKILVNYIKV